MTIRPISSPDIVIPDNDDDDPRSPFPATSPTLYQLYDHHRTTTPIFDSGESDGDVHFPLTILP